LVFAVNDEQSANGQSDAGVAMLCAYNYVEEKKDAPAALAFLTDVYARSGESKGNLFIN